MNDFMDTTRAGKVDRAIGQQDEQRGRNAHAIRLDAHRPAESNDWEDAGTVVAATFLVHKLIFEALAPYNSKQHSNNKPYIPPSMEFLRMAVKRQPSAINDLTYNNMLQAIKKFSEDHKGCKQLAYPDPVTIHSAHFPEGTFKISEVELNEWLEIAGDRPYRPSSCHKFEFSGLGKPVYVENYRPDNHKYVILRPKLSKLGVPLMHNWEALFYKKNFGYYVDRVDAELNPRYAGLAPSKGRKG
jgi:hypothetical protein